MKVQTKIKAGNHPGSYNMFRADFDSGRMDMRMKTKIKAGDNDADSTLHPW